MKYYKTGRTELYGAESRDSKFRLGMSGKKLGERAATGEGSLLIHTHTAKICKKHNTANGIFLLLTYHVQLFNHHTLTF